MTIEEAIYSHLTAETTMTDLVSTRIYPRQLPQNPTYPAVTYRRVSTSLDHLHGSATNLPFPRFQFNCYATSYGDTKTVANALKSVLDGFSGTFGGSIAVGAILSLNEVDGFDPIAEVPVTSVDFVIIYQES